MHSVVSYFILRIYGKKETQALVNDTHNLKIPRNEPYVVV